MNSLKTSIFFKPYKLYWHTERQQRRKMEWDREWRKWCIRNSVGIGNVEEQLVNTTSRVLGGGAVRIKKKGTNETNANEHKMAFWKKTVYVENK